MENIDNHINNVFSLLTWNRFIISGFLRWNNFFRTWFNFILRNLVEKLNDFSIFLLEYFRLICKFRNKIITINIFENFGFWQNLYKFEFRLCMLNERVIWWAKSEFDLIFLWILNSPLFRNKFLEMVCGKEFHTLDVLFGIGYRL